MRIIYYCDPNLVLAMYVYAKSNTEDIPVKQIRDALSALLESSSVDSRFMHPVQNGLGSARAAAVDNGILETNR